MYVFILEEKNRFSFHDFTSMNFPQSDFAGTSLHGLHQGPCLWSLILDSGILNVFRRRPGFTLAILEDFFTSNMHRSFQLRCCKDPN